MYHEPTYGHRIHLRVLRSIIQINLGNSILNKSSSILDATPLSLSLSLARASIEKQSTTLLRRGLDRNWFLLFPDKPRVNHSSVPRVRRYLAIFHSGPSQGYTGIHTRTRSTGKEDRRIQKRVYSTPAEGRRKANRQETRPAAITNNDKFPGTKHR